LQKHLNGPGMMMQTFPEEDMLYGLLILSIILITFGPMEAKGLLCFIIPLHQLGVVHVLVS
jgi:hypothetical protein